MEDCCPQGYVVTYAHVKACDHVTQEGTCFISGKPGDGKTTLAYEVLKKLSVENCHPVQLRSPAQCEHIPVEKLSDNYKLILFVDDVCGSGNLNDSLLEQWSQELGQLKPYIRKGLVRVLMTSRTHISKHFRGPDAASEEVLSTAPGVDLGDADFQLSQNEMEQILMTFLRYRDIALPDDVNIESLMKAAERSLEIGYPQVCRFFAENKLAQIDPVSYFSNPVAFLKKDFHRLRLYDRVSFLALILVISGEGALSHSYLNHEDNKQDWLRTAERLGITEGVVSGKIIEKADKLCGTYLSFDSSTKTYTFTHDSLFDTLLLFLLETDTEKALDVCTAQQLNAYIRAEEKSSDDQTTMYRVSECEWPLLAARLIKEIIFGDADLACSHPSLKGPKFVKVIEEALSEDLAGQMLSVHSKGEYVCDRYEAVTGSPFRFMEKKAIMNPLVPNFTSFFESFYMFYRFQYHSPLSALLMNGCVSPVRHVLGSQAFAGFPQNQKSSLLTEVLTVACHTSDAKMVRFLTDKEAQPSVESVRAACSAQMDSVSLVEDALGWSRRLPKEEVFKTLHDVARAACWKGRPQTLRLVLEEIQAQQAEASSVFDHIYTEVLYLTHPSRRRGVLLENKRPTNLAEILSVFRETGARLDPCLDDFFIAGHGDVSTLQEFLEAQGGLTADWERETTLLHVAARFGATENVRHLLHLAETAGAPLPQYVNALTRDGQSALHLAARYGHVAVVEILLQSGADAKMLDSENSSALYLLSTADVWEGLDEEVTRPDIDTYSVPPPATPPRRKQAKGEEFRSVLLTLVEASRDQVTASLHPAVKHGRTVLVEVLLSHGADAEAEDDNARTAFELALLHRRNDIAELLFAAGPSVSPSPGQVTSAESEAGSMMPKRGGSPLHTAATVGSISFVERLLTRGADIEARNRAGETPLHLAARLGQIPIVDLLLRKGARIDAIDKRNRSLLHHVTEGCGALPVVEKLLREGADVTSQDVKGKTPLHLAAEKGFLPLVHRFLQERAQIDAADSNRYTPLHYAAENGHLGIVKLLLKENADSGKQDNRGHTALDLALLENRYPVTHWMLSKGCHSTLTQVSGLTALHIIARRRAGPPDFAEKSKEAILQIVKMLSHLVDTENENGETPIFMSLESDKSIITQELLKNNCNVNHQNHMGETPVFKALQSNHSSELQELIKYGCDIDHQNEAGDSPIFIALGRRGATAAAQELLRHNCDLSLINKRGDSVLHALAEESNTEEVVAAVLQKAAHLVNHENNDGDTPLLTALQNRNAFLARQLLLKTDCNVNQRNKQGDTPIVLALQMGEQGIIDKLLERNCDVFSTDGDGRTVLHVLAEQRLNNVELAGFLVRKAPGLVNCQNKEGDTPLFLAIRNSNDVLIQELLEYNDPSMSNGEKDTALHILARECRSTPETVKNLVSRSSCCVNRRNKQGDTPIFLALMYCKHVVTQELLKQKCDLSLKNKDNDSVLHMLARQVRNDPETVVALVEQGRFLLNHQNKRGETPVFMALKHGKDQVVGELLKQNCDTSITNNNADTILHALAAPSFITSETIKTVLELVPDLINRQNQNGDTPIFTAVREGNKAVIRELLTRCDCDLAVTNCRGDTVLHAMAGGKLFCTEALVEILQRTSDWVDHQNKDGDTPLLTALRKGNEAAALALLEHGCDVSIVNNNNDSALHVAASCFNRGNSKIVTMLLERAGNLVNQQNKDGDTPLFAALRKGRQDMFVDMLKLSAFISPQAEDANASPYVRKEEVVQAPPCHDISDENDDGEIIYVRNNAAVRNHRKHICSVISEGEGTPVNLRSGEAIQEAPQHACDINHQDNEGETLLMLAAQRGYSAMTGELLKRGCDVNLENKDGETALFAAVRGENAAVVRDLLRHSCDVNHQNKNGETSLFMAVRTHNYQAVLRELLEQGGDPNHRNHSGDTPLLAALRNNKEAAALALLEHGCDASILNNNNDTALHVAASQWRRNPKIVRLLLERAGNLVNQQNKDGDTPLFAAVRVGDHFMYRELLKLSAVICPQAKNADGSLHIRSGATVQAPPNHDENDDGEIIYVRSKVVVAGLPRRAGDVTSGEQDDVPLINVRSEEAIQEAPRQACDINHQNNKGETLLMLAAQEGDRAMTGELLKRGCDVNLENKDGETALFVAVRGGNAAVVRDLLRHSCDVNHQNKNGETPLFLAVSTDYKEAVLRELLEHGGDTNHRNQAGDTPLLKAVVQGCDAATRELLKHPCSATARNNSDRTVLHALAEGRLRNPETVASVVKFASEVIDSQDKEGNTPLLLAFFCQNTLVAAELLKENCDVSIRSNRGHTVLHVLAASPLMLQRNPAVNLYRSDWEGVVLKLEGLCRSANIDLNTPDRDGKTPRDIVKGNQRHVRKLRRRYSDYRPPIHFLQQWRQEMKNARETKNRRD